MSALATPISPTFFEPKPPPAAAPSPQALSPQTLAPSDLAELLAAFNEVTARLNTAQESLKAEVVRLQGELRQANEQIERSKRLASLGEMAAGIAHEVRNPLGSIRLYAKMLVDDLGAGADVRTRERATAEKIAAATRGLDAVVTDVLAFAREMRVDPHPVEAGAMLSRAIDECLASDRDDQRSRFSAAAPPRPLHVIRDDEIAEMDSEIIVCDAPLIHRALVNVIRNAIQAMREHGQTLELRTTIERRVLPDRTGAGKQYTALIIRDSGPGIPPEIMDRMFNPFFTTRATGTGLGLSIVHRIMDAHAGRVIVKNVDGSGGAVQGAVIELLLPDSATPGPNTPGMRRLGDESRGSPRSASQS